MLTEIWLRLWALGAAACWTGVVLLSVTLGLCLCGALIQAGRR